VETCSIIPNVTSKIVDCNDDEACVVLAEVTCISPPCLPIGKCHLATIMDEAVDHRFCYHRDGGLDRCCAKLSLTFEPKLLPVVRCIVNNVSFLHRLYLSLLLIDMNTLKHSHRHFFKLFCHI